MRKAIAMHDTSKYDDKRKKETEDWNRNRQEFGTRMSVGNGHIFVENPYLMIKYRIS